MKAVNIQNKRVRFEYNLLDKYVAGLQLSGTEIKSIRNNKANLSDSFCSFPLNEQNESLKFGLLLRIDLISVPLSCKPATYL